MAVEKIKIRKTNNPSVTKTIQAQALKTYTRRGWEVAPGENLPSALTATKTSGKKNDAAPAEDHESDQSQSPENHFGPVGDDDAADNSVPAPTLDELKEQYKAAFGKEPDKRWKESRLKEELLKV